MSLISSSMNSERRANWATLTGHSSTYDTVARVVTASREASRSGLARGEATIRQKRSYEENYCEFDHYVDSDYDPSGITELRGQAT